MIALRKADVPEYLRVSEFYGSLEDSDDSLSIPACCFKVDRTLRNLEDVTLLLSTLRFWGVSSIPAELIQYAAFYAGPGIRRICNEFESEHRYLEFLEKFMDVMELSSPFEACEGDIGQADKDSISWADQPSTNTALVCALQYRKQRGIVWNAKTCKLAVELGRLDVLKYLHEQGCPWDKETCSTACEEYVSSRNIHKIACLRYAHENGCPWSAEATSVAIQCRNTEALQYLRDNGCPCDEKSCETAALVGDLSLLKFYHESGCPWDEKTCERAALLGRLECLTYAHEQGCPWTSSTCATACRFGELACLQYAHKNGCPWDQSVLIASLAASTMECLKYSIEHQCPGLETLLLNIPWLTCHPATLQYLHEQGCSWSAVTVEHLAASGQFESLRYALEHCCPGSAQVTADVATDLTTLQCAHQHNCPWDEDTLKASAASLACFQYALENGCPGKARACEFASGDLECLQYAHRFGCPLPTAAYTNAVRNIECVRYLHQHGCPFSDDSCTKAASGKNESLEVLIFMHEHGAPWSYHTLSAATKAGHLECVKYAVEHGCARNDWFSPSLCTIAATYGHLEILTFLHLSGCAVTAETCAEAAWGGHLPCLQYLHSVGCPWNARVTESAAAGGNLLCLQYLHTHQCPWNADLIESIEEYKFIFTEGRKHCLDYARAHGCPEPGWFNGKVRLAVVGGVAMGVIVLAVVTMSACAYVVLKNIKSCPKMNTLPNGSF